jgi:hypothetical protein
MLSGPYLYFLPNQEYNGENIVMYKLERKPAGGAKNKQDE